MLLLGKHKDSFLLIIIALFGLFLRETPDLLALDAENNIVKLNEGVDGLKVHTLHSHRNHYKIQHPLG
jgi:hypothetical protein